MLLELHIKNIAVIEELTVSFGEGFHALTGETGAGKSILIDSILMALGGRSSKDLIRSGCDTATVDLVFAPSDVAQERLSEIGVDTEDGMVYISRQLDADGKSKARINGHMVPVTQLKEAAELLLTVHGQNDNQQILSPKTHLAFLDEYGNYQELLAEYRGQYKTVRAIQAELMQYQTDEAEQERTGDLLRYQIQEIDSAKLREGEEEELTERRSFLANIEQITENCGRAYNDLYGDADGGAAYDKLTAAVRCLEAVRDYDGKLDGYYQTLSSTLADLEDVTHELKSYLDGVDYSREELDEIENRLSIVSDLKRKYGGSIDAILAFCEEKKQMLAKMEHSDEERERLEQELAAGTAALRDLGLRLSDARKQAAIALQTAIMKELSDLDMQKMRFSVSVQPAEEEFGPNGQDDVASLISANPGEELRPLAKIASGGEMSRIMLAIKSVLADSDTVDTLIFDEIDTGVSGRAAQKIAEKICMLSKQRQILCITHLAQIASMADIHFLIEKNTDVQHTTTTMQQLGNHRRKEELARIIGGIEVTAITLQAAQEMLDMAEQFKQGR